MYYWINRYRKNTKIDTPMSTLQELYSARKRIKKLEGLVGVLKTVDCTAASPLRQKLNAMTPLYGQYSIHTICEAMNVPRGTFYNHILRSKRNESWFMKRREDLKQQIRNIYDKSRQIYGAGKIRAVLMSNGYIISERFVSELMREIGLRSIRISSKKDSSMMARTEQKVNILKQNFDVDRPDKVWVSDITCYKFKENYYYICVFIDLFSRKVLSVSIGRNNSTHLVKVALMTAFTNRKPTNLIIHSDRGIAYTSYSMQNFIHIYGITQSYSNPGKPLDNAVVESFFSSLKTEELYRHEYRSELKLRESVAKYVKFYNSIRLHKYLNYKTPDQAEIAYWKISTINR
jgi:transposase InsO family protein